MLRSTFSGFTTAQLAMRASQKALDVTGQNIANINTVGYTRQRLDVVSLNAINGDATTIGYGVDLKAVSQSRDPFLDIQYRTHIAKVGTTDSKQAGIDSLTDIFDETNKSAIKNAFSDITSKLQSLSLPANTGNQVFDNMVRSSCQSLIDYFHQNATALAGARKEMSANLKDVDVKNANTLMEEISKLNSQIKNSEILGNPCLELKDSRNNMLDELATYLPVDVKYSTQKIGGGGIAVDVLSVTFTDSAGAVHSLINDDKFGKFDVDNTGIPVKMSLTESDGVTVVNDMQDKNFIGNGVFKGSLIMLNESGQYSGDDTKGFGFYEKSLDSLVNTFATTFNELNKDRDGNEHPLFETSDGATNADGTPKFTAGNIKISDGWMNGTTKITTSKDAEPGSTKADNVLLMINAMTSKRDFKSEDGTQIYYHGNFQEYYSNTEDQLGVDGKANSELLKNQLTVLKQISNSKDSVSGVSLDEEGMSLMHYQQSFSAAARLMTTLDEALDKLINGTGVVGR